MTFNIADIIEPDKQGRRILNWDFFSDLDESHSWSEILEDSSVEIDLRGLDILSHDGLIWISFILLYRSTNNLYSYITLPDNENQVAYLRLVGLHSLQQYLNFSFSNEYLMSLRKYENDYKVKNDVYKQLRKIEFINGSNWPRVANSSTHSIKKYLINTYGLNPIGQEAFEHLDPFTSTIQELLHNIVLHGGFEDGDGIGFISFTPPPKNYPIIRYCFSDIGEGFKSTLEKKHGEKCKNEKEAILKGLLLRAFNKEEGILGLYNTLKFIRDRNGSIFILSGDYRVELDLSKEVYRSKFDEGYRSADMDWLKSLVTARKKQLIPGVHICVNLRLPI